VWLRVLSERNGWMRHRQFGLIIVFFKDLFPNLFACHEADQGMKVK
jgi:hypothetical protein